jgi:glutamate 5-kinase
MMQTYVIKVGTQTLTTADGLLDHAVLANLIAQIATLKKQGHFVVLVSSGAVGTGRGLLQRRPHLKNTNIINAPLIHERQILAAMGQAYLMQAYQHILDGYNLQSAQILLTKQDFITKHHYQNIAHLFQSLRQQDFILPIVNENDSVAIQELMFTDNDELAGLLAAQLGADRLLLLTNVAGVYDRSPSEPDARIIPIIDPQGKHGVPMPALTAEKSALGRGGMQSKINTARKMSRLGITTHIASGHEPNIITRLAAQEPLGTTVLPQRKASSVKRWLAVAPGETIETPSVIANERLTEQLKNPDKILSILPVGLLAIKGQFKKGERVQVLSEADELLAIGLARYDAVQLQSYLGQQQQPVFLHVDSLFRTVAA